jgi:hypothetical protein
MNALLFTIWVLGILLAYNPWSGTGSLLVIADAYFLLAVATMLLTLPAVFLVIFHRRSISLNIRLYFASIPVFLVMQLGFSAVNGHLLHNALERVVSHGAPLVDAIQKYQLNHHGIAPAKLSVLVPEYLSALPHTGVGALEFEYETPARFHSLDDSWMLQVPYYRTMAAYTMLIRTATARYPKFPAVECSLSPVPSHPDWATYFDVS